jgi:pimeloyl-ACP methyl ester carboxylesterase
VVEAFGDAEDRLLDQGDIAAAVELNLSMWFDGADRPPPPEDARRVAVGVMQRRAFELQLEAGDAAPAEPLVRDLGSRLGEISVPTVVLVGEHDASDFHLIGRRLAATLPRAIYEVVPGAAHVPYFEHPGRFLPILDEALRTIAGPGAPVR